MQLDTLTLCIVIALGGALLISVGMMFRSWRDASSSAYYFHRKQSLSSMQSYALTSVVLGVLLVALTTFATTPTTNSDPLIRVIRNAKPSSQFAVAPDAVQQATTPLLAQTTTEEENVVAESFEPNTPAVAGALVPAAPIEETVVEAQDAQIENIVAEENVPAVEAVESAPQVEIEVVDEAGTASIKDIVFSTQITDGYAPANPSVVFDSGYYTMYATFIHENMVSGTTWSWKWTQNGTVVGSGSRTWVDNPTGHGYIYFSPTDGFGTGDYQLTIWVNGAMSDAGQMKVTSNVAQ